MWAFLAPRVAEAAPPDYRRIHVYVHPSFQLSRFLGQLDPDTSWGIGFGVTQGVQFQWIGFNLTIDTDYYLTDQEPPPFNRGVQLAALRLATRLLFPVWELRPFAELSFQRIAIISNALVNRTGPELGAHSVGGTVGVRYAGLAPFYVEIRTDLDYVVDLDDTTLFSIHLGFGVWSLL